MDGTLKSEQYKGKPTSQGGGVLRLAGPSKGQIPYPDNLSPTHMLLTKHRLNIIIINQLNILNIN